MNTNLLALFGIIASVGLLTMVIASATPTMTAFAAGDKCISGQKDDRAFFGCSTDKQSYMFSGIGIILPELLVGIGSVIMGRTSIV